MLEFQLLWLFPHVFVVTSASFRILMHVFIVTRTWTLFCGTHRLHLTWDECNLGSLTSIYICCHGSRWTALLHKLIQKGSWALFLALSTIKYLSTNIGPSFKKMNFEILFEGFQWIRFLTPQAWGPELESAASCKTSSIALHACNPSTGGQRQVDPKSAVTCQLSRNYELWWEGHKMGSTWGRHPVSFSGLLMVMSERDHPYTHRHHTHTHVHIIVTHTYTRERGGELMW